METTERFSIINITYIYSVFFSRPNFPLKPEGNITVADSYSTLCCVSFPGRMAPFIASLIDALPS
jgi:hypothetical protein